jgi:2-oxoglutarate dehydrogenase E2 component (dihydrolipoamide succinyltransferase)
MSQIFEITMPKLGETVTEGTVAEWLKSVGDEVAFDDPLILVSTDKVDSEIPSPYDGVLLEIAVPDGTTVPVGTVLARIGPADSLALAGTASPATTGTPAPAGPPAATNGTPASAQAGGHGRTLSPVVRRLVAEHGLDLSAIVGTGAQGRIMREDVLAALDAATRTAARSTPPQPSAPVAAAPPAAVEQPVPRASDGSRADEVRPLSRIRLVTAERMVESKRISPHVWTSVEVDLESIEQIRLRHRERFRAEHGCSLTYLAFIARAVSDALRVFPAVNASVDMENRTLVLHRRVDLAIAVDLDEQGLLAPVIRDADLLNLRGMARAIKAVGEGAKNRTLGSDDLSGSTFTITNPGPLGSFASAPIINQPNVAIMSTEGVSRRPTVVGDAIAIHHMCVLGFSYDHRAFDGVTAARFLGHVRDLLQARDWEAELT